MEVTPGLTMQMTMRAYTVDLKNMVVSPVNIPLKSGEPIAILCHFQHFVNNILRQPGDFSWDKNGAIS